MTALIETKKTVKSNLHPSQKTFNSLKKKLEALRKKLSSVHNELDQHLLFYKNQIHPEQKALQQANQEIIILIYGHYKKSNFLTKSDKKILKEILVEKIGQILDLSILNDKESEICKIVEDLEGVDRDEMRATVQEQFKEGLQERFEENGIDVDLSSLQFEEDDTEAEMLRKVFEAMKEANFEGFPFEDDHEAPKRPKTKKQLEKETKEQELAELQKKGLSSIYRQLVKALHPDLEQDAKKKAEKEALMKKLIQAYESKDLHTLLQLEMDWMTHSKNEHKTESDDQIKLYNSVLKKQIKDLEDEIEVAVLNPKYSHLHPYFERYDAPLKMALKQEYQTIKTAQKNYKAIIQELQGPSAKQTIKELIASVMYEYMMEQQFPL